MPEIDGAISKMESQLLVRMVRGTVMAATAFILFQMQTYLSISGWLLALAFGLLGTMHSTERVARLGLSILIVSVLIPPDIMQAAARWVLALRNGTDL